MNKKPSLATSQGKKAAIMPKTMPITIDHLIEAYLADLRVRGYKPKTINGYTKNLTTFWNWAKAHHKENLSQFSSDLIKTYIGYLQTKTKWSERGYDVSKAELLSPTSIRNYIRDLKAFSSWLLEEQYTRENVLLTVRVPKADEVPPDPFSDEELATIFRILKPADPFDLRDYVLLHTLWDTGMRVGELVNLTLSDVDLKSCQIRIQHAKFGKWRDIGFGNETHKYLTRYLTLCRPQPTIEGDQHFFLAFDGYPMTESTVQKICYRLTKRTGVHVHCHRFRHTFAVNMLRAGTDLRTLQRLMGHSDIRILARYLNLATNDVIKAHQTNSPADRYHRSEQLSARRLPIRRPRLS
jgi:integrase/recombinase XerD